MYWGLLGHKHRQHSPVPSPLLLNSRISHLHTQELLLLLCFLSLHPQTDTSPPTLLHISPSICRAAVTARRPARLSDLAATRVFSPLTIRPTLRRLQIAPVREPGAGRQPPRPGLRLQDGGRRHARVHREGRHGKVSFYSKEEAQRLALLPQSERVEGSNPRSEHFLFRISMFPLHARGFSVDTLTFFPGAKTCR